MSKKYSPKRLARYARAMVPVENTHPIACPCDSCTLVRRTAYLKRNPGRKILDPGTHGFFTADYKGV